MHNLPGKYSDFLWQLGHSLVARDASMGTLDDAEWHQTLPSEMKVSTRILIVDDSPLIRTKLRELLQQHAGWQVYDEASNGKDAVDRVKKGAPDVVVLDFLMPEMDGLHAAREIQHVAPKVPILMFTMQLSPELITEARRAGVRGAVPKSEPRAIVAGVEAVLRNESFFAPQN